MSLSLGSNVIMEFRHPEGRKVDIFVPRRSLLVMSGDARLLWSHGITPRKTDQLPTGELNVRERRVSLTFRKVRPLNEPCECPFWAQCDRRKESTHGSNSRNKVISTPIVETKYVHEMYDIIGPHFSSTRHSPWPAVMSWVESLPTGSVLADIGCGNGRYLGLNPNIFKLGADRSSSLTRICSDRGFDAITSDALILPLRSGAFDAAMCIAVIHHLSSVARRAQAIRELLRIVKPGGLVLVYVWALEQPDRSFGQPDLFVPWRLPEHGKAQAPKRTLDEHQRAEAEQDRAFRVMKRFYHVFRVRFRCTHPSDQLTPHVRHWRA